MQRFAPIAVPVALLDSSSSSTKLCRGRSGCLQIHPLRTIEDNCLMQCHLVRKLQLKYLPKTSRNKTQKISSPMRSSSGIDMGPSQRLPLEQNCLKRGSEAREFFLALGSFCFDPSKNLCYSSTSKWKSHQKHIHILLESHAALRVLNNFKKASQLVTETWENLKELARNSTVVFYSISAHGGIKGNKQADLLAREGS